MYGFPGVSYLTAQNGTEVNDPARRITGATEATVNVAPHGTAVADVLLVQAGDFSASACQPVDATVIRVYPPDETTPLYAADHEKICSVKGTGVPQINPVTAP
jgi:hypothetical protein